MKENGIYIHLYIYIYTSIYKYVLICTKDFSPLKSPLQTREKNTWVCDNRKKNTNSVVVLERVDFRREIAEIWKFLGPHDGHTGFILKKDTETDGQIGPAKKYVRTRA